MKFYAAARKPFGGQGDLFCRSGTIEGVEKKLNDRYWNAKGTQPKGTDFPKSEFLAEFIIVSVEVYCVKTYKV